MRGVRRFLKRLLSSAARHREAERLQEEMEQHLELQTAENLRSGLDPPAKLEGLYGRIEDRLSHVSGVVDLALCSYSPLSGNNFGGAVWISGHLTPGPNEDTEASYDRVTEGYFTVIGTPIVNGRGIDERDMAWSEHIAVINQAFARKFFPNAAPIGQYFGWAGDRPTRFEVIGVAKDARYLTFDVDQPIQPFFFLPGSQHDLATDAGTERDTGSHYMQNIVIVSALGRTVSDLSLRQALASVDSNLPITTIHKLREQVDDVFRARQLIARLTSCFSLLSLILCSIGLYGVTAYSAGQRTPEIGLRIALGANRRNALVLLLRGPFALILTGLTLGLPLTFAVNRLLASQVHGLNPNDKLKLRAENCQLA